MHRVQKLLSNYGYCSRRQAEELIKAGADKDYIKKYLNEATAGDYDHLLGVTMKYVDVY